MCNIAICDVDSGTHMFCDAHRCRGLTTKKNRCESSMNCGIEHAAYMPIPEVSNKLVLMCLQCGTNFSFVKDTPVAIAAAESFVKNKGVCKHCR